MARLINFTRGEARALLHRLESGTLAEFAGDCPSDWVEARCAYFARDLKTREPFVCVHPEGTPGRALDLALLTECIEGSTWPAVAASPRGAYLCLRRAALKITTVFRTSPYAIDIPSPQE